MKLLRRLRKLTPALCRLVPPLLRLYAATLRCRVVDPQHHLEQDEPRIFVLWHNRLVLAPVLAPGPLRRRVTFLASRSRDGAYIAEVLEAFEMRSIRGSSSRGGAEALRLLQQELEQGRHVCITPDGPRGPRYAVQEGAVWLARRSGKAVVPVSLNSRAHWELRSWDRTQLPRPFSRVELIFGNAVSCRADESVEAGCERVRAGMLAITIGDHEPEPR